MKILLTGATGFIGSQVLRLLSARGYPIRALRRQGSKMDLIGDLPHQPEWFEGDITDIVAMEEVDRYKGFFSPMLKLFGYESFFAPKSRSPCLPLG